MRKRDDELMRDVRYGGHPASCNCAACTEKRLKKLGIKEEETVVNQAVNDTDDERGRGLVAEKEPQHLDRPLWKVLRCVQATQ